MGFPQKKERNKAVYEMRLSKDEKGKLYSFDKIGVQFNITRARAKSIFDFERKKHAKEQE